MFHRGSRFLSLFAALLALPFSALGQSPSGIDSEALVLRGATVHTMAGPAIEATVVLQDGLILAVGGEDDEGFVIPADAVSIDLTGLDLYPGFFDALSQLGLVEINSISATVDSSEIGRYNPHLQAATAVHPASEVLPVTRANGVTHTVAAPQAANDGVIAGQGSLIHLDGWTVEEMSVDSGLAMIVHWPRIETRSFDFTTFSVTEKPYTEAKKEADEKIAELREWFGAARHYRQAADSGSSRVTRDLALEALARALESMPVVIVASSKADIEAALDFAEDTGIEMILAGGVDAWRVEERLAAMGVPVILGLTASLPGQEDDPYDRPFRTAGELAEAGVLVAFGSGAGGGDGPGGPHSSRTLPYEAAFAVPYGLERDEALRALTINAARIFGVDDRLGTIEPGKIANLIAVDGDPLDFTGEVRHLFIAGREVETDNKHRQLWERYRSRPLPEETSP